MRVAKVVITGAVLFLVPVRGLGIKPPPLIASPFAPYCLNGGAEAIRVCEGLNLLREKNGVPAVRSDRHLTDVAETYARQMAESGKLTHGKFRERMNHAGISMPRAENIAYGQVTPEEVLLTWTRSPGHFANMTNPKYTIVGIGFHQNYWVQIFSAGER